LVDLGDAAVFGIAEGADEGDDIQAELVLGQGVAALLLGAVGGIGVNLRFVVVVSWARQRGCV
jgi:hypothetical protein